MKTSRFVTIEFMDGTKRKFVLPEQAASAAGKQFKLEQLLTSHSLIVVADGKMNYFPMENIKVIEFSGPPDAMKDVRMPLNSIVGASEVA